jgi:hypothetical protein
MATTLLLIPGVNTPHAAFFSFSSDDGGSASLVKSGAVPGVDVNVSALPEGPLKTLLLRADNWQDAHVGGIAHKVIVKLSEAPDGTAHTMPLTGVPTVTQSKGLSVDIQSDAIAFSADSSFAESGVLNCSIEVRLMHSKVR